MTTKYDVLIFCLCKSVRTTTAVVPNRWSSDPRGSSVRCGESAG